MKRRKFLGLFGSAIAAPMVPIPALAQTGYSQAAWNTAVATARSSAALSVGGMANILKLPPAATETLMRDMIKQGILGPLSGPRHGGHWAVSRIMKPGNIAALHKAQQAAQGQAKVDEIGQDNPQAPATHVPDWIVHLRQMCVQNGMTLHARCFA